MFFLVFFVVCLFFLVFFVVSLDFFFVFDFVGKIAEEVDD